MTDNQATQKRFRTLTGLPSGTLHTGTRNSITDVAGVAVGHTTRLEADDIRTGVTAILPHSTSLFRQKVPAAVHTINGFGKAVGFEQIRELGTLETPILLTNTLCVGRVADACISYLLPDHPELWSVNPLVGECNDSYLNAIQKRVITEADVLNAINSASETVIEGCVGAGTGTVCYGFKGGIGTASRLADSYTVGALVQTNFGARQDLRILGVPIGHYIPDDSALDDPGGSVMIILATDAPLTARQLGRLAHRATFGLARTGTICDHGSGDFVVAFSTAYQLAGESQSIERLPDQALTPLFRAVVESVEESIYNALVAAETITGRDGNTLYALPHDHLLHYLKTHQVSAS